MHPSDHIDVWGVYPRRRGFSMPILRNIERQAHGGRSLFQIYRKVAVQLSFGRGVHGGETAEAMSAKRKT